MFLEQYWGGPKTYSEQRGHPRLRMRHEPFRITSVERDAWLHHMGDAVDELDLDAGAASHAVGLLRARGTVHGQRAGRARRRKSDAVAEWWRDAVVYQVYVRSFADSDGDGIGDLPGVRSRLPYLKDLGVDALWLTPFYTSPMADGGYDVADYRDVDPMFGSLADFDALVDVSRTTLGPARDRRHRAQPLQRPARAGSRLRSRPAPAARSGIASTSDRSTPSTPTPRPTTGRRRSAGRRGHASPSPMARSASGTSTSSRPEQPDFDWDHPDVAAEFEVDPAVLARSGRRRLPDRRRTRPGQGSGLPSLGAELAAPAPREQPRPRPGHADVRPAGHPRDLPRLAFDPGLLRRRADDGRRGLARQRDRAGALPPARRAATRPSTSDGCSHHGTPQSSTRW